MKIGFIACTLKPTNILATGGIEVFISLMAKKLRDKGHEIIVFGSGDSQIEGVNLVRTSDFSLLEIQRQLELKENMELNFTEKFTAANSLNIRNIYCAKMYENQVDVFHENIPSPIFTSLWNLFDKPVISTMHAPVQRFLNYESIFDLYINTKITYVAVSKFQQKLFPTQTRHIYNGIDIKDYPVNQYCNQQKIIWIGRIDPNTPKGLDDAITAAKNTKHNLAFVGFVEVIGYYKEAIEPLLDATIQREKQFSSSSEKVNFYRSGKVSLIPIQWEEPFGFTFIESMAAGTPVIAYARGSAPEIIKDGETGFLVNPSENDIRGNWIIKGCGIRGLCEAIEKIYNIPQDEYLKMRIDCRKHVEEKFTLEQMVDNYEKLYLEVAASHE